MRPPRLGEGADTSTYLAEINTAYQRVQNEITYHAAAAAAAATAAGTGGEHGRREGQTGEGGRGDDEAAREVPESATVTGQMLLDATGATGGLVRPQVLLTVASRFARISWKYEGMAYATTLRNVGAFYQTLWLVATAMGIACCPLGGGDASAFAEATIIEVVTMIGESVLGKIWRVMMRVIVRISSMMRSPEQASLLSVYLVGFQLPLSGAILALPEFIEPFTRPFISAYWAWSGSLNTMVASDYQQAVERVAGSTSGFSVCVFVLAAHIAAGIVISYIGCRKHQWD